MRDRTFELTSDNKSFGIATLSSPSSFVGDQKRFNWSARILRLLSLPASAASLSFSSCWTWLHLLPLLSVRLLPLAIKRDLLVDDSAWLIEAIVQDGSARGSISNINALNTQLENQVSIGSESQPQGGSSQVPAAFKNFSLSQKERTLEELVQDKWLCTTLDDNVGLGVRSFMDLRSWFRNNDVPACDVCNEAGVKADLCPNESCTVRIHNYCLTRKFAQRMSERVCPGCGAKWKCSVPKHERVEEEDIPNGSSQDQPPPEPTMRKKLRSSRTGDVDTGRFGSSQTSTFMPEARTTRRSSRLTSASQS